MAAASPETVLVAMSGGVDSSVAAALLVERGVRVVGAFMRNGVRARSDADPRRQGCCGVEDSHDARRVADQLGVPFYAVNLEDAFDSLIESFVAAYRSGRTPNPCIECNRSFKFGRLMALAEEIGADAVASGHYARVDRRDGRVAVRRARDETKDQSYVLYPLEQEVLGRVRFPLGEMTKAEVRAEARRFGLRTAEKPESMEICFVPSGDYRDVIRERAPEALATRGSVVHVDGRVLGEHDGAAAFTIGQRRGLPGGHPSPLHVVRIDAAANRVIVGPREALAERGFVVSNVVFSGASPAAGARLRGRAKIRHQHDPEPCTAEIGDGGVVRFAFDEPVFAVTPGQAAVLYDDEGRVLLGGRIDDRVPV